MRELIKKLTEISSPSGNEDDIRNFIKKEIKNHCDSIETDAMGNLIARINGKKNGKTVLFDAHMDEIGVMVNHIDQNGFLRFTAIGGFFPFHALVHRIRFQNGVIGVIGEEKRDSSTKVSPLDKLYIDIGAKSKKEAEKMVGIGDMGTYAAETIVTKDRIIAKSLDDRIGCYIMIKAMKTIKNPKNTVYFVFASQEEVGVRGARPAAYRIDPDCAVALDVTGTGDTPESNKMEVKLDGGAAIKVKDSGMITNRKIRDELVDVAKKHKIKYQFEILEHGTTDAFGIQITAGGIPTGAISIPSRYIHSPSEMVSVSDVEACTDLVVAFANEYDV
ncbi:MAG: M20/M25/M40 family metallo-hydrolase [Proteobacteria bacterium]|nr:M20/M25/M40 family metallo-hydrolase [Pseudomonadota bacterium]